MIQARLTTRLAARLLLLTTTAALVAASAPALGQEPAGGPSRTARTTVARQRGAAASAAAKGSQGWWGGTVAMLAILGGAGALCVAARRQADGADGARLKIVGRVGLPPKHAVFLVRAGGRTLLIGTGPQGAPSLLGELDDDAAPVVAPRDESAARPARPIHAQHRIDVRLGDES